MNDRRITIASILSRALSCAPCCASKKRIYKRDQIGEKKTEISECRDSCELRCLAAAADYSNHTFAIAKVCSSSKWMVGKAAASGTYRKKIDRIFAIAVYEPNKSLLEIEQNEKSNYFRLTDIFEERVRHKIQSSLPFRLTDKIYYRIHEAK